MTEFRDKKTLRRICSDKRAAVQLKAQKDSAIAKRILSDERIIGADTVLLYASFGSEVSTAEIIRSLIALKKPVALPKCENNGIMKFHIVTSEDQLSAGKYGIPEPDDTLAAPVLTERTAVVVPGLAFTEKGYRLGYGGGYYDRFIADNPFVYTIGITYEELIAPSLPCLPHDITVNAIATEERMVLCCAEK